MLQPCFQSVSKRGVSLVLLLVIWTSWNCLVMRFHAAGHSLGGALASLAAFDIQRHCPCLNPMDVSCYTFGAPRVGNHAFARQYDATVPDTWNIINNQVRSASACFCAVMHFNTAILSSAYSLLTKIDTSTSCGTSMSHKSQTSR